MDEHSAQAGGQPLLTREILILAAVVVLGPSAPQAQPNPGTAAARQQPTAAGRPSAYACYAPTLPPNRWRAACRETPSAAAIRFSTLTRLCQALDCQPGDLLSHDGATIQAGRQPAPGG